MTSEKKFHKNFDTVKPLNSEIAPADISFCNIKFLLNSGFTVVTCTFCSL